ncbi:hNH endonuclease [Shigella flexneri]|uniref:hNH endonuclease n=1 Tax=Shigella flexneri TaxID=623 RepID=UPI00107E18C8|nr:hNH endonuclease [Shigella flexneri]EFZ7875109.1 hNH endonuclease [Shigella flexneri]HBH7704578.1 hNH endonuclease [Shigella flexneri]
MKQMSLIEMDGFLKGKCIPCDLKVNETNAEYLVRKFAEAEAKISALYEDHQKAIESIKQADAAVKLAHEKFSALAAENAGMKSVIEYCINPDNQPEYHDQGMGCGVEDHGYQRDGYSACYYGWESAMDRVYSEVIPDAIPETPATDTFLDEVRAQGVEMFAASMKVVGGHEPPYSAMANEFAAQLRKGGGQ